MNKHQHGGRKRKKPVFQRW